MIYLLLVYGVYERASKNYNVGHPAGIAFEGQPADVFLLVAMVFRKSLSTGL